MIGPSFGFVPGSAQCAYVISHTTLPTKPKLTCRTPAWPLELDSLGVVALQRPNRPDPVRKSSKISFALVTSRLVLPAGFCQALSGTHRSCSLDSVLTNSPPTVGGGQDRSRPRAPPHGCHSLFPVGVDVRHGPCWRFLICRRVSVSHTVGSIEGTFAPLSRSHRAASRKRVVHLRSHRS
ncbi:hypothetical protein VTO42DRAFT_4549 [Malbranchea cinnamomea]